MCCPHKTIDTTDICPTITAPTTISLSLASIASIQSSGTNLLFLNPCSKGCSTIQMYPNVVIEQDPNSVTALLNISSTTAYSFLIPNNTVLAPGFARLIFKPISANCPTTILPITFTV